MVKWNGVAFKCVLLSFLLLVSCYARATSALSQFLIKTSKGGKAALNLFTPATKLVLKLDFNEEYNLHEYKFNEVRNALTSLASSQSTLKSLDGLTHKIRNTVKDNTSLQSRFKKYIKSDKRNVKEAGKLYEYTNSVERGLQAAEILQSVSFATENERHLGLDELGLVELKRIFVTSNGIQCTITFLVATNQQQQVDYDSHKTDLSTSNKDERRRLQSAPRRYLPNELIVAIVDDSSSATSTDSHSALVPLLATILSEAPVTVEIGEEGFSQDEVSLQPSLLSLSRQVLMALAEFILPEKLPRSETQPEEEEVEVKKKKKIAKSSKSKRENPKSDFSDGGELDRKAKRVSTTSDSHRSSSSPVGVSKLPPVVARCGRLVPSRVRLLGHSAGGAVAAYVSMALDGTLRGLEAVLVEDGPEATKGAQEEEQAAGDLSRCTGAFHDKVRCVALGPPPCVSRSVVPQYIRTIVCGDDMVVRATRESLNTFARRLLKALERGAGSGMPVGYVLGARWMGDVRSVAAKSLKRYTGSKHDISTLSLPGRVIFAKARKIKSGATLQRVLRGNWQEDVLWQLHEILPSKKMLEHHSLENYIQTLNRC